jgi:hypothetical protein
MNYPATSSFMQQFGISVPKASSTFFQILAEAKLVKKKFKPRKEYSTTPLCRLYSDICGFLIGAMMDTFNLLRK